MADGEFQNFWISSDPVKYSPEPFHRSQMNIVDESSKNQQTPRREVAESHRNSRYLVYVKERGPGEHWVFRSLNVGRVPHKVPVCRGGLTRKRYPTVSRRNCAETPPNARGLLLSGNPTQQSIITGATDNSGAVLRIQALRAEIREDLRCDRRTRAPPCGGDWRRSSVARDQSPIATRPWKPRGYIP